VSLKRKTKQQITLDNRNANKGTEKGKALLNKSLSEYGAGRSILLDKHNRIIAGNKTFEAAKKNNLKVKTVETDGSELIAVKRIDLVLEATGKARELAYLDNRVAQLDLEWNGEQLINDIGKGVDLEKLGFGSKETEEIIKHCGIKKELDDIEPQIDKAKELQKKWGTALGQLWALGAHRLLCGDCTKKEVITLLLKNEKPVILCDPPYGISVVVGGKAGGGGKTHFGRIGGGKLVRANTYAKIENDETTDVANKFYNLCVELGIKDMILFGGNYFSNFLPPSRCWIVWDKENTGNFADGELAWTSFDRGVRIYHWLWNGLCRKGFRGVEMRSRIHPTQKPVGLFENIILDFTEKDNIIFDGFLGSGTTLIACEKSNRRCRAVELLPAYVAVALERWSQVTGKQPKLLER
jgi:site-specific DNA-methyltransferase (adenine-specific)/modification methylase